MLSSVSELQSVPQSAEPAMMVSSNDACAIDSKNALTESTTSKIAPEAREFNDSSVFKVFHDSFKVFIGFDVVLFILFYCAALKEYWCGWNKFTSCYFFIPLFGILILLACLTGIPDDKVNEADQKGTENIFQGCCWILFLAYLIMIWR